MSCQEIQRAKNEGTYHNKNNKVFLSGNSASKNEGTYCNKNNKVFLIRNSHLNRINKENFRKIFKGDSVYFKSFSGADTKQIITLFSC